MTAGRQPAEAFPVHEYILEEMAIRKWEVLDLAGVLGRPVEEVVAILAGDKHLLARDAERLSGAWGTNPAFWLNLQRAYRLWKQAKP